MQIVRFNPNKRSRTNITHQCNLPLYNKAKDTLKHNTNMLLEKLKTYLFINFGCNRNHGMQIYIIYWAAGSNLFRKNAPQQQSTAAMYECMLMTHRHACPHHTTGYIILTNNKTRKTGKGPVINDWRPTSCLSPTATSSSGSKQF